MIWDLWVEQRVLEVDPCLLLSPAHVSDWILMSAAQNIHHGICLPRVLGSRHLAYHSLQGLRLPFSLVGSFGVELARGCSKKW